MSQAFADMWFECSCRSQSFDCDTHVLLGFKSYGWSLRKAMLKEEKDSKIACFKDIASRIMKGCLLQG